VRSFHFPRDALNGVLLTRNFRGAKKGDEGVSNYRLSTARQAAAAAARRHRRHGSPEKAKPPPPPTEKEAYGNR